MFLKAPLTSHCASLSCRICATPPFGAILLQVCNLPQLTRGTHTGVVAIGGLLKDVARLALLSEWALFCVL